MGGEWVWFIPNISWSSQGGFSAGGSVTFGVPGGVSAQIGGGYNSGSNEAFGHAGVTFAANTLYTSYSSTSGWSVGYTFGMSNYAGFNYSTNFASLGVNYNITNNSWSGNISSLYVGEDGWSFNPSFSVMVFPEHSTNFVRGKGFRSNNSVLSRFVNSGNHQQALDYFGFEGSYKGKKPGGGEYVEGNEYFGSTNPKTGEVSFGNLAFDSYDNLYSTARKEAFHSNRVKSGKSLETTDLPRMKYYPEEALGFKHAFKNSGLYPNSSINNFQNANSYWLQSTGNILMQDRTMNVVYKIPRLW